MSDIDDRPWIDIRYILRDERVEIYSVSGIVRDAKVAKGAPIREPTAWTNFRRIHCVGYRRFHPRGPEVLSGDLMAIKWRPLMVVGESGRIGGSERAIAEISERHMIAQMPGVEEERQKAMGKIGESGRESEKRAVGMNEWICLECGHEWPEQRRPESIPIDHAECYKCGRIGKLKSRIGDAGRRSEKRAAERLGMGQTPASGAGPAKGDLRDDDWVVECKSTLKASYSLKLNELVKARVEAFGAGKKPALLVTFTDEWGRPRTDGAYVVIPEWLFGAMRAALRLEEKL